MFVEWAKKCLVLVTVLAAAGAAADNACTHTPASPTGHVVFHSNTLTLYQPVDLVGPPELTARVRWRASPEALYRIIWDYAQFRKHIPGVKKSEVLQEEGRRKWIYQQLILPAPLQDRHYVLESTDLGSRPDRHHYQVEWQLSDRFPLPANQLTRPAAFSGCWDIHPDGEGGLRALYHIVLDPAGSVPHWIARRGMRRYVKQLVERLTASTSSVAIP